MKQVRSYTYTLDAVPAAVRAAAWTALSVLAWLSIFSVLLSTGILWSLVGRNLQRDRAYVLEAQLFDAGSRDFDTVVVGDGLFITACRERMPSSAGRVLYLTIPSFHSADLQAFVDAMSGRLKPDRLVIQSSPHHWSNFWARSTPLNIELWLQYRSIPRPSFRAARTVFRALNARAQLTASAASSDSRPTSLMAVQWQATPDRASAALKKLGNVSSNEYRSVFWLRDVRQLAPDASPELVSAFEARFGESKFLTDFGNVITNLSELR